MLFLPSSLFSYYKTYFSMSTQIYARYYASWLFLFGSHYMAQLVKNPPAMRETWVRFLGWDDPLVEGMAIHSSILAWRIPGTIQSMGSQRVRHNWVIFTFTFIFLNINTVLIFKKHMKWKMTKEIRQFLEVSKCLFNSYVRYQIMAR